MARVTITKREINPSDVIAQVMKDSCGGIVVFIGTVRDNFRGRPVKKVKVESYGPAARADLRRIIDNACARHRLGAAAAVHRTGELSVGDVVLVVAVAAPHRKSAFSACEEIIDQMKKTTPIWKQELFKEGSRWVESES